MSRPSERTIKHLFALSGNQCAFPKCTVPLVHEAKTVTGVICHIKAEKPGWARYDPAQSDEERHAFGNLIIMCGTHHKVVDDDEESYTVERLHAMKRAHEAKHSGGAEPPDGITAQFLAQFLHTDLPHGSQILTQGQVGGQVAHSILNIGTQEPPLMPELGVRWANGSETLEVPSLLKLTQAEVVARLEGFLPPNELIQAAEETLDKLEKRDKELRSQGYVPRASDSELALERVQLACGRIGMIRLSLNLARGPFDGLRDGLNLTKRVIPFAVEVHNSGTCPAKRVTIRIHETPEVAFQKAADVPQYDYFFPEERPAGLADLAQILQQAEEAFAVENVGEFWEAPQSAVVVEDRFPMGRPSTLQAAPCPRGFRPLDLNMSVDLRESHVEIWLSSLKHCSKKAVASEDIVVRTSLENGQRIPVEYDCLGDNTPRRQRGRLEVVGG